MERRSKMENMGNIKGCTIIVTGGMGFIGSHLVKELITLDAKITVVDIKLDKRSFFAQQKLEKKVNIQFIDIAKKKKINDLFLAIKPTYVFHLAAEAIVNNSYKKP